MSREPTMDEDLFNKLIKDAEALGLNTQNLPVTLTQQDGC